MCAINSFAGRVACLVVATVLLSNTALAAQSPRINYMIHCMGCHLIDGTGSPPDVPSLPQHLGQFLLVEGGREYLIQVPGTAYSPLSDAETAEVLNWMLETFARNQLSDDFVPYTANEVAQHRSQALTDVNTIRDQLLSNLEQQEPAEH
ncbi:MAG: hypothetical protein VX533_02680 [Pseudomonadota bacterium]|nr:hypothetical protein [Pseudomonadota bacterium]